MEAYPTAPKIQFPIITTPIWDTSIVNFRGKAEQRQQNYSDKILQFGFSYKNLNASNKNIIVDFFKARNGNHESFTWTNPEDSVEYTVKFREEGLGVDYIDYDLWDITNVVLIEVI